MSEPTVTETTETVENTEVIEAPVDLNTKLHQLEDAFYEQKEKSAQDTSEEILEELAEDPEVEKTEEVEVAKNDEDDDFTDRFTQLAKREAVLRKRESQQKEFSGQLEELNKFKELQKLAKTDPLKVAESLGISVNSLADQTIDKLAFDEKNKIDDVTTRLQKLEDLKRDADAERAQRHQQAEGQKYVDMIVQNITDNADKYPLVKELTGGTQLVINTIAEYYQRSGEEMPWDRAAQMTEEYLTDQKVKEYQQITKIDKIRKQLGLTAVDTTAAIAPPAAKVKPVSGGIKAISNTVASAPAIREVGKVSQEERERRIRELADNLFD